MAVANDRAEPLRRGDGRIGSNKPVLLREAPRFPLRGVQGALRLGRQEERPAAKGGEAAVTDRAPARRSSRSKGPGWADLREIGPRECRGRPPSSRARSATPHIHADGEALLGRKRRVRRTRSPSASSPRRDGRRLRPGGNPGEGETVEIPRRREGRHRQHRRRARLTALVEGSAKGAPQHLVDYPVRLRRAARDRRRSRRSYFHPPRPRRAPPPGIAPADITPRFAQETLVDLERYQCPDGGFCNLLGGRLLDDLAYLRDYIVHVYQRGEQLGYDVNDSVLARIDYLGGWREEPPVNEGWWPTRRGGLAIKVLAWGRPQPGRQQLQPTYAYLDRFYVASRYRTSTTALAA